MTSSRQLHKPDTMRIIVTVLLFLLAGARQLSAIVLFGQENSANQADPGTGVQFDAVARVYNTGNGATLGTAIHLGGGYMLTANHVPATVGQSYTFDGVNAHTLDNGFTPTQVAPGVDLKVFRLTTVPIVSAVTLGSGVVTDAPATLIGWGRGRDPLDPPGSTTVAWGDATTIAKRWGLNTPLDLPTVSYPSYSFTGIRTVLGSSSGEPAGLGDDEAAVTQYDSGSGMFQFSGGGWRLVGVAVAVEQAEFSVFGDDSLASEARGHENYFVHIGSYRQDILKLVPEPSACLLLAGSFLLVWRRRVSRG